MILLNKKVVKDGSDSSLLDNYDLPGSMLNFTITSSNIHCIVPLIIWLENKPHSTQYTNLFVYIKNRVGRCKSAWCEQIIRQI